MSLTKWIVYAAASAAAGACALRGPARAEPETTVALLPRTGDATGQAYVSNAGSTVHLVEGRQATRVSSGRPPAAPVALGDAEIQRLFGDALSAMPLPVERWVLRFEFGSDDLTPDSRALLAEVLRRVRERPLPEVTVVGHTDTTGNAASNLKLGLMRADAVRRLLVEAGVDGALVETSSHGEADPLVPTPDGTAEPANRRVDIELR